MILVELDEVNSSLPDLFGYLCWNQLFDGLHETRLAVATFRGSLGCSIVQSFGHWIWRYHFLHVVSELTKKFVIKANGPVLTEEFNNVRDQAIVITLAYFVQILDWQADKWHKRGDYYLLASKIGNILNQAIGIDWKFDVVSFEVFDCFGNQLFASDSSFKHNFRQRVICPFDVVVYHIFKKSTTNTNRHVQLRKLLLGVFISSQIT